MMLTFRAKKYWPQMPVRFAREASTGMHKTDTHKKGALRRPFHISSEEARDQSLPSAASFTYVVSKRIFTFLGLPNSLPSANCMPITFTLGAP